MGCLTYSEIRKIAKSVSDFSNHEYKCSSSEENQINDLLDSINGFKKALSDKTRKVSEINERINELRGYDNLDQRGIMFMHDVISSAKELHSLLVSQHVSMNSILAHGIAGDVIKDFKDSIDELIKSNTNLERLNRRTLLKVKYPAGQSR